MKPLKEDSFLQHFTFRFTFSQLANIQSFYPKQFTPLYTQWAPRGSVSWSKTTRQERTYWPCGSWTAALPTDLQLLHVLFLFNINIDWSNNWPQNNLLNEKVRMHIRWNASHQVPQWWHGSVGSIPYILPENQLLINACMWIEFSFPDIALNPNSKSWKFTKTKTFGHI